MIANLPKLYFILLGALPPGRSIEQHDVFFGIASSLTALKPDILEFWPEAVGKIHLDGYRAVTQIGDFSIEVVPRDSDLTSDWKLFFINLGGYKPGEIEEFHYKCLIVANSKAEAIKQAKESTFYKHTGFNGAVSHIDDKYGVDVDDVFEMEEALAEKFLNQYKLFINPRKGVPEDSLNIGYFKFDKL
ncbi:MAG: DUF1543 domain-containing protein [Pedobacter sp.]|nr:MAG: DUF1543 domain-containing protein [Pedobacter sp.]